jgi:AcrR family transcriptional regulator
MTTTSKRRAGRPAGRPRQAVLSRDRIVVAALDLIDEVGDEGFSLAELADRMGVRASSFYNHTTGKDDILAGVQDLITESIDDWMWDELPWPDATVEWAHSYRDAFIAHPHAIVLFATATVGGMPRTLQMYERIVIAFEDAGWPKEEVIPVLIGLESFLLGSALDAVAPIAQLEPGTGAPAVPRFSAAVKARNRRARRRKCRPQDLAFETGLAAMVEGLNARLEASAK